MFKLIFPAEKYNDGTFIVRAKVSKSRRLLEDVSFGVGVKNAQKAFKVSSWELIIIPSLILLFVCGGLYKLFKKWRKRSKLTPSKYKDENKDENEKDENKEEV